MSTEDIDHIIGQYIQPDVKSADACEGTSVTWSQCVLREEASE